MLCSTGFTVDSDSLQKVLKHTSSPLEKIRIYYQVASEFEKSDPDSAILFYLMGLELAQKSNNDTLTANGYLNAGVLKLNTAKYNEAINYLFKALKLFQENQHEKNTIRCLQYIGIAHNELGNVDNARNYSLQAMKIAESINDNYSIATSMMMLGNSYYTQSDTDKALDYFRQALFKMEASGDQQGISDALNNVAVIYEQKNQYSMALVFHLRSLQMAKKLNDKRGVAASFHNIGLVYMNLKSFPVAIQYIDSCMKIADEMGDRSYIKECYNTLSEIYARMGKYDLAYNNHVRYSKLNDTLLNEDARRQFAELSTRFETEHKDQEISLLNKDKEIQKVKMQRQQLVRNAFIGGFAIVLLFAVIFLNQRNKISKEKKRSDELLLNILPEETAEELKLKGTTSAKDFEQVTVMFTDFKDFTKLSERLTAQELVNEINFFYSSFDQIIAKYGIEKIKTIGDSYMCAGGLPIATNTNAEDTVKAALEIMDFMLAERKKREAEGKTFFEIRIGCHTGPVIAGIVGIRKFAYDIWGDTVNIASRMESSGEPGKVNISGSTYELVKDKFTCIHRGKIEARNKGMIDMYFVET